MPVIKLSQQAIDSLQCPASKSRIEYCDKDMTGLYVLVSSKSNIKSYFLRYKDENGKTCHQKLGRTTDIDLDEARRRAKTLKAQITLGKDPSADKKARKAIPTLTTFMEEQYIPYQKERIRGWSRQNALFENHLKPTFGDQRLDRITLHSVQKFLTSLRNEGYAASTSNHPIRVLKHATELARKWGIIETNQLAGLPLLREENKVNNIMTDSELSRLLTVLRTDKNKMVGSICLFLLSSGCRLNEALKSRWEHFDLHNRVWTIPSEHSKSRKIRSVPLNDSAINILNNLGTKGKYDHVFIARGGKPFTTIHKVWTRLRADAGLPHLRLHDLRHQYASLLINQGRTLYEVQAILGHSDPSVTQRYAHLSTKSLQAAADSASEAIGGTIPESP